MLPKSGKQFEIPSLPSFPIRGVLEPGMGILFCGGGVRDLLSVTQ